MDCDACGYTERHRSAGKSFGETNDVCGYSMDSLANKEPVRRNRLVLRQRCKVYFAPGKFQ